MESDSLILNNTSDEGGIFYGIDNIFFEIYFKNTIFAGNLALDSLISIENSFNITFMNVTFVDNKNLLFSFSSTEINLLFSVINNLECSNMLPACLAYLRNEAIFVIDHVQIRNVNNLLSEGGIRLENSALIMSQTHLINMKTIKKQGSCISGISSVLKINAISAENYDMNCIFLEKAIMNLANSLFRNYKLSEDDAFGDFGTIVCKNCLSFNVLFTVFDSNNYLKNGGAITLSSISLDEENSINSCLFLNIKVKNQGGALFIDDTKLEIYNSSFFGNEALDGGAIFFQGILLYKL